MFQKKLLVISMATAITGCSAMGLLSPKPAVGVDAQIGEEANKQVIVGDQNRTSVEDNQISGDLVQSIAQIGTDFSGDLQSGSFTINNMPTMEIIGWGALVSFILGFVFPSPFEIFRKVRRGIHSLKDKNYDSK